MSEEIFCYQKRQEYKDIKTEKIKNKKVAVNFGRE